MAYDCRRLEEVDATRLEGDRSRKVEPSPGTNCTNSGDLISKVICFIDSFSDVF